MRRLGYLLLTVGFVALCVGFAMRRDGSRLRPLPVVGAPAEIAGRSCADSLVKARELTKGAAHDRARLAYLWLLANCQDATLLPEAMIEAGSLFGHLLQQPREARQVYAEFLGRFPAHPYADVAAYQLAKLELDAGDYSAAIGHLTLLNERYPNSPHRESAAFLATKAAEMLNASRRSLWTLPGQLAAVVPNNLFSLLAVVAALGPSIIQTAYKAKGGTGGEQTRRLIPAIIIALTLLNYVINNVQTAQRNEALMEKLDQLAASAHFEGDR